MSDRRIPLLTTTVRNIPVVELVWRDGSSTYISMEQARNLAHDLLAMLQENDGVSDILNRLHAVEARVQVLESQWASVPRADIRTVLTGLFDFLPEASRETQDSWLRVGNWINANAPEEGTNANR